MKKVENKNVETRTNYCEKEVVYPFCLLTPGWLKYWWQKLGDLNIDLDIKS